MGKRWPPMVKLRTGVFVSSSSGMTARRLVLVTSLFLAGINHALSGTKRTPTGSSVKDVMAFISEQLQRAPGISLSTVEPVKDESHPRAAKAIRVYLGQYYDHPEVVFLSTPLVMQREVTAQWFFDSHDRLIDIAVEKQNGLY